VLQGSAGVALEFEQKVNDATSSTSCTVDGFGTAAQVSGGLCKDQLPIRGEVSTVSGLGTWAKSRENATLKELTRKRSINVARKEDVLGFAPQKLECTSRGTASHRPPYL